MPTFNLSRIPPNARGYRARNGIVAQLYRYLKSSAKPGSGKLPSGQAVCVPVPRTTSAEAFRVYITNYLRNRKGMLVSTSFKTKSKTDLLVWLRGTEIVDEGGTTRSEIPLYQLEMAPLWPLDATDEDAGDSSEDYIDADGTPVMRL